MKKGIPCLLLTLLMFSSEGVADEIMLRNGDRVTGAIVGLEGGELEIQSELLGALTADWEDIEGLRSDNAFYVRLSDARLLVGSLALNLDTLEIRTRETGIIEVPTGLIESIRSAEQHELFQSRSERLENPGAHRFLVRSRRRRSQRHFGQRQHNCRQRRSTGGTDNEGQRVQRLSDDNLRGQLDPRTVRHDSQCHPRRLPVRDPPERPAFHVRIHGSGVRSVFRIWICGWCWEEDSGSI